jgi:hypothetical protein
MKLIVDPKLKLLSGDVEVLVLQEGRGRGMGCDELIWRSCQPPIRVSPYTLLSRLRVVPVVSATNVNFP